MAKNRVTYLAFLAALTIFLYLTDQQIVFTALYAALLLPIFSFLLFVIARRGLVVDQRLSEEETVKGNGAGYELTLTNRSPLPLFRVRVAFQAGNPAVRADAPALEVYLPAKGSRSASFGLTGLYRGVHQVGVREIRLYDWLGLFSLRKKPGRPALWTVLPRVFPPERLPLSPAAGDAGAPGARGLEEDYAEIASLRQYVPTDSIKRVHWKMSARKGTLISREFQPEASLTVALALDNSPLPGRGEAPLALEDRMMEAFVSVLAFCERRQYAVSLEYPGRDRAAAGGAGQPDLYRQAARIPFDGRDFPAFLEAAALADCADLCVFSAQAGEALCDCLIRRRLEGHRVLFFHFCPLEEERQDRLLAAGVQCVPSGKEAMPHGPS